jgi:hypothetical protein
MTSAVNALRRKTMYSEGRLQMSRSYERLAIRRSLAAVIAERESGLGIERFADPFESKAGASTQSADQRVEDL